MKFYLTFYLVIYVPTFLFAQKPAVIPAVSRAIIGHDKAKSTAKDTVMESDTSKENKEPRYYYASINSNIYVNTKGAVGDRFSPVAEFGRAYGIFEIGVAGGRLKTTGRDTVSFLEMRPTINVFSKGRFAESLCLGAGYVFGAKQALMTEICNSINLNVSENVQVSISQGYCFYDGRNSSRTGQYMGLGLAYNFLKGHSVNKQRKKQAIVSDQ
ncbi:hypothetical protein [Mucilaginibacter aquaedulcis]|uniref:hypothetical protein n=1 Tax=Mucilaginibacter aquaedulcis TaxID=1187081 RepID=UPI0025B4FF63|nr:hypothetical protein [Mucilaginibacter aquaedulcis]MDN3550233.1 hypothetical protein [Mucilaginibacter aquaedulcis]